MYVYIQQYLWSMVILKWTKIRADDDDDDDDEEGLWGVNPIEGFGFEV